MNERIVRAQATGLKMYVVVIVFVITAMLGVGLAALFDGGNPINGPALPATTQGGTSCSSG